MASREALIFRIGSSSLFAARKEESKITNVELNRYGEVSKFEFAGITYISMLDGASKSVKKDFTGYVNLSRYNEFLDKKIKNIPILDFEKNSFLFRYKLVPAQKGDFIEASYSDYSGIRKYYLKWVYDGKKCTPPFLDGNVSESIPVVFPFSANGAANGTLLLDQNISGSLFKGVNPTVSEFDTHNLNQFYLDHAGRESSEGPGIIIHPIVIADICRILQGVNEKILKSLITYNLWPQIVSGGGITYDDQIYLEFTNEQFISLRNKLSFYVETLTRLDNFLTNSNILSNPELMFYLVDGLSIDQLRLVDVQDKLKILKCLSSGDLTSGSLNFMYIAFGGSVSFYNLYRSPVVNNNFYQKEELFTNDVESLVVKILKSIDLTYLTICTEFLEGLISQEYSFRKGRFTLTLFQKLYEGFYDLGVSRDHVKSFANHIYEIWKNSEFNIYNSNNELVSSSLSRYTWSEINSPIIPYESRSALGYYFDNFKFRFPTEADEDPDFSIGYSEVYNGKILAFKETKERIQGYNNSLTRHRIFGEYDVFQPVTLLATSNAAGQTETKIPANGVVFVEVNGQQIPEPNYQVVPIFFLKFVDDSGDSNDFLTTVGYFTDVISVFSGFGNLAKLKHIKELSKVRNILSFISIETIIVIRGATAIIELSAGVINFATKVFANDCNNTPSNSFCNAMKDFVTYCELLSLSADFLTNVALVKKAKNLADEIDNLPANEKADFLAQNIAHNGDNISGTLFKSSIDQVGDVQGLINDFLDNYPAEYLNLKNAVLNDTYLLGEYKLEFLYFIDECEDIIRKKFVSDPSLIEYFKFAKNNDVNLLYSVEDLLLFEKNRNIIPDLVVHAETKPEVYEVYNAIKKDAENGYEISSEILEETTEVVTDYIDAVPPASTSNYWKSFANGKKFENFVTAGLADRTSAVFNQIKSDVLSYLNVDISEYHVFEQVQIYRSKNPITGKIEWATPDFVLVKYDASGDIVDSIILDCKLNSTTAFTKAQKILFNQDKLVIRSIMKSSISSPVGSTQKTLTQNSVLKFNVREWIKIWDGSTNGAQIDGTTHITKLNYN